MAIFVKSISGSTESSTSCLRKLRFQCYQMWISQKWPNLDYFTGDFGVFEQFLAKPHLVARQNMTFWRFGKNMSGYHSLNFESQILSLFRLYINSIPLKSKSIKYSATNMVNISNRCLKFSLYLNVWQGTCKIKDQNKPAMQPFWSKIAGQKTIETINSWLLGKNLIKCLASKITILFHVLTTLFQSTSFTNFTCKRPVIWT